MNEFLGSMSFGIRHLTNPKKEVNGWYYLLTEDVGRKKHLQVSHRQHPQLKIRSKLNWKKIVPIQRILISHNVLLYKLRF